MHAHTRRADHKNTYGFTVPAGLDSSAIPQQLKGFRIREPDFTAKHFGPILDGFDTARVGVIAQLDLVTLKRL